MNELEKYAFDRQHRLSEKAMRDVLSRQKKAFYPFGPNVSDLEKIIAGATAGGVAGGAAAPIRDDRGQRDRLRSALTGGALGGAGAMSPIIYEMIKSKYF